MNQPFLLILILSIVYFGYIYLKEVYPLRDMNDEEYDHLHGEGASASRPSFRTVFKKMIEVGAVGALSVGMYNWVLPFVEEIKPDTVHPVAFTTVPPF